MENVTSILLKFVEGKMTVQEFENELYINGELEDLLRQSTDWSGTYIGNAANDLYNYLIALDYSGMDGQINAIGALELYFAKKGITYSKTNKYPELYDLILASQPKYLDVDTSFIEKYILPVDENLTKTELKKIIRTNFEKYFRFQSKPPHWLQSPAWIIKDEKPLYFVGQLELKNKLFHDDGMVYIFLNEDTGEIETIMQFY
ncbi:MAG: hypothetical protein LBV72_04730 [Tannerella sp.]|jgi:hypothetical protein|nr:hypothetical protein [Tannerella sp.]